MSFAQVGDKVRVSKRSNGAGKLEVANDTIDTIDAVYMDGRVRLSSGDIWYVKPDRHSHAKWVVVH